MIHELGEPTLPNIVEDVFANLTSVVDEAALEGYRKYAREELEKGVAPLRELTEKANAAMEEMHASDIVRNHLHHYHLIPS